MISKEVPYFVKILQMCENNEIEMERSHSMRFHEISNFRIFFKNFYSETERTCINKVDDLLNIFMSQIAQINHTKVCCCIWLKSEIRHIPTSIKIILKVQSINRNFSIFFKFFRFRVKTKSYLDKWNTIR